LQLQHEQVVAAVTHHRVLAVLVAAVTMEPQEQ